MTVVRDRLPRGIRNHNPGNIRRGRDRWKGLAAVQTDLDFCVFDEPEWGIRAMAVILRNYQRKHGLTTVAQMIRRWAPPGENDTAAYIKAVARELKVPPQTAIDVQDPALLRDLIAAIIRHENGRQPYGRDLMRRAIGLA